MNNNKISERSSNKLRIVPIGGLDKIGSNSTVFEYGNDAFVLDAGMGFPLADLYGVDYQIPNPKYLIKIKKKIKGVVITHGHLDHIGAIPHLLEYMDFPDLYISPFAKELVLNKLKMDFPDILTKVTFRNIDRDSRFRLGNFNLEMFGVNHSIPESMGVIIKSPVGTVVHTGDFKFDSTPLNEPQADYDKIAKVGAEGVLCLLSDSTNSYKEGHCLSEKEITEKLDTFIEGVKGRVVVATFSSMVNRIVELLKIAQKNKRKVLVSGYSMKLAIKTAHKIGYAKFPKELFVSGNDLKQLRDDQVMILSTGAQGEEMAALSRIARNGHKEFKVKKGDTIVLSSSVIPGNGASVQVLIDELTKKGADVFHNSIMDTHTTGHGHKEEQKLMLNLVKPKFFMPVHGFHSFRHAHGKTGMELGIPEENVIYAENGDFIELDRNSWNITGSVDARPVNVSGSIVGDVGEIVIDDRQKLAKYGVVVYSLSIDKKKRTLLKKPHIVSRGFVFMKNSKDMIDKATELIEKAYDKNNNKKTTEDIREVINKELKDYLYSETEREPMLLSIINYI